ncbi:hypothetical protein J3F83DRAFT_341356 [Trichoderma novae-zelandiae]
MGVLREFQWKTKERINRFVSFFFSNMTTSLNATNASHACVFYSTLNFPFSPFSLLKAGLKVKVLFLIIFLFSSSSFFTICHGS